MSARAKTITLRACTTQHLLVVTDEGPGLSDEDKAHARLRFWRGDSQRTGSGLGLAIAEGLATASCGSLVLGDAPTGGLQVTVAFPVTDRPPPPA